MFEFFQPTKSNPDCQLQWSSEFNDVPVVIDNGAFECRAGFANRFEPHLVFRNVIYKPRMTKTVLVGNDIADVESVRHLLKSPFLEYLLTGMEVQEHIFDHIFDRLGVQSETVAHPILINEVLCNPRVCRAQLNELLFETYGVPKLAYYIDGLASYYDYCSKHQKSAPRGSCLVLSLGYHSTHFIPLIPTDQSRTEPFECFNFDPIPCAARRIHVGGAHVNWLLQRLLQLKYPCHSDRISSGLTENLLHNHGYVVPNYREEMPKWRDEAYRLSNTRIVQLPFIQPSMEELNAVADRKRAQAVRLLDIHRRRQLQQLDTIRERLQKLFTLEDMIDQHRLNTSASVEITSPIRCELERTGLTSEDALYEEIERCQNVESALEDQLAANEANEARGSMNGTTPTSPTTASGESRSVASGISQLIGPDNRLKPSSSLSGRQKKAAESLVSLALPAAVQAQMIAGPAPNESKLNEAKLNQRIRLAMDLEATQGEDYVSWLMSIRHRRFKVAKRRTQRQSRIDLATEIGLHGPGAAGGAGTGLPVDEVQTKSVNTSGMSQLASDQSLNGQMGSAEARGSQKVSTAGGTTASGDFVERRGMTERRRLQLEKIRAMAAELRPTRPRGAKPGAGRSAGGRGSQTTAASATSRGHGKGGRGARGSRGGRLSMGSSNWTQKRPLSDTEDMDTGPDEVSNPVAATDEWDDAEMTGADSIIPASPMWDLDTEENSNLQIDASSRDADSRGLTSTKPIPDASYQDPEDESESERDQLAVLDTLLTLYDPEAARDLGCAGLNMPLDKFYQVHVNTELPRACEVFFQPSFLGSSEAGFGECFDFVLRDMNRERMKHPKRIPDQWPSRVFLAGSLAKLTGLPERIYAELRPLLPYGHEGDQLEIIVSDDPKLGAWHGARRLALENPADIYITRQLYEECGSDYLVEHPIGNRAWKVVNTMDS